MKAKKNVLCTGISGVSVCPGGIDRPGAFRRRKAGFSGGGRAAYWRRQTREAGLRVNSPVMRSACFGLIYFVIFTWSYVLVYIHTIYVPLH
jgi:hypothetical protein